LETVRRVEPRWVQSEEQVAFLERFASMMNERKQSSRTDIKQAI
jgi:atypical dual specificity phosphatase